MASTSLASSRGSSSVWTARQNKIFKEALAVSDEETPDGWQKVARAIGGKTAEDVKTHYDILVRDVMNIESGQIPLPDYNPSCHKRFMR